MKNITMKRMMLLVLLSVPSFVFAQSTFKIDDTGTQLLSPVVQMSWEDPVPQRGAVTSSNITGEFGVRVRLNTAPWKGQVGRIYLTSPTPPSGPFHIAWRSLGVLQDGQMVSGQRVLVYTGPITQDVMTETMKFSLRTDGNNVATHQMLQFNFEIDLGGTP